MKYKNDTPSGLKERQEGIVEVKLWEAFLLHNRNNIYSTLSTYAIENGPLDDAKSEQSTVDFRFTSYDWNNTLKKMLNSHNIPVIKEKVVIKREAVIHE
jgi:hypothetical protein